MFSRNSNKGQNEGAAVQANKKPAAPSIVSGDMRMVGDLTSQGEIQIDGAVEGDVRAKSLLIGETADVRGEIFADSIVVHGRVTGQIKARSVHLAKKAHVVGDILHEDLSIETGAYLEGHCKWLPAKKEAETVAGRLVKEAAPVPSKGFVEPPRKLATTG
jgi:cytoskeletal protein CcmA (bactofilin family)